MYQVKEILEILHALDEPQSGATLDLVVKNQGIIISNQGVIDRHVSALSDQNVALAHAVGWDFIALFVLLLIFCVMGLYAFTEVYKLRKRVSHALLVIERLGVVIDDGYFFDQFGGAHRRPSDSRPDASNVLSPPPVPPGGKV